MPSTGSIVFWTLYAVAQYVMLRMYPNAAIANYDSDSDGSKYDFERDAGTGVEIVVEARMFADYTLES